MGTEGYGKSTKPIWLKKLRLNVTLDLFSNWYGIDYLLLVVTITVFSPTTDIGKHDLQFVIMEHPLLGQSE